MNEFTFYKADGTTVNTEMISVSNNVKLKIVHFAPIEKKTNPPVLFIAGWITQMFAWELVLKEMTKDFEVYYVETREKMSSQVTGKANFGVEDIARDIVALVELFQFKEKEFLLFGSSLGATAILETCQYLKVAPLCLVLVGPNAVFRVPRFGKLIIRIFWPRLYLILKPFIKWYLKTFRLDVKSDYAQYQKYCANLDGADPWKLKNAAIRLSKYAVWGYLDKINYPALIVGASKDTLHTPENLHQMVEKLPQATFLDLETNKQTHSETMVAEMRKYLATIS
jgi:pimeloyl-ACP methyl ester carboxylesterase